MICEALKIYCNINETTQMSSDVPPKRKSSVLYGDTAQQQGLQTLFNIKDEEKGKDALFLVLKELLGECGSIPRPSLG